MSCRNVRMFVYFLFVELYKKTIRLFYSSVFDRNGTRFLTYYDNNNEYIMIVKKNTNPHYTSFFVSAEIKSENGQTFDVTDTLKKLLVNENQVTLNDVLNIENIKVYQEDFYTIEITDNDLNTRTFLQFDILF